MGAAGFIGVPGGHGRDPGRDPLSVRLGFWGLGSDVVARTLRRRQVEAPDPDDSPFGVTTHVGRVSFPAEQAHDRTRWRFPEVVQIVETTAEEESLPERSNDG
jgi:hypothetical protein